MRAGLVLVELLITLVVAAILAAIAVPRVAALADAAAVRDEALRVVTELDAARGASVRLGVVATLVLSDTSYRAMAIVGTDTVITSSHAGPGFRGVALGGSSQPISFGPAGLAMGVSNRTITLVRGTATRRVVMSKYGRLTY